MNISSRSRPIPVISRGKMGFNGEYLERSGVQILGSYRAYTPYLMCFHSPDNLSPFRRGGLNAYTYCLGDPVNRIDPTGHLPWWAWKAVTPARIAGASGTLMVGALAGAIAASKDESKTLLIWTAALFAGAATAAAVTPITLKIMAPARHNTIKRWWKDRSTKPSSRPTLNTGTTTRATVMEGANEIAQNTVPRSSTPTALIFAPPSPRKPGGTGPREEDPPPPYASLFPNGPPPVPGVPRQMPGSPLPVPATRNEDIRQAGMKQR